jgi:hypothetical protein
MRAPALCLLIAVGASGISAVEDAVNSKKVPAQVSYSEDEFKALLDRRSLAEHASRRRLKQEFGYCSGGPNCHSGAPCDRFCSDKGMDKDACVGSILNLLTQCQWNDMTIPAVVVVCCIVTCIVICCVCCCRRRKRRNREMSMPLNVTVMQPGMMQPVMTQPVMVQMPYQQMSGKA